ncbi:MAG: AMP-binding protein, partial [Catonella sp.]
IITGKIAHEVLLNIYQKIKDTNPVYIVFTSGSTGVPKGVMASHRNVIDYIEGLGEILECDENTVFGNQAPLYLDASLKDIYTTLKYGATTYFIPKKLFMAPVKLIEYFNENKINTICFVASALTIFTKLSAFEYAKSKYLKVIAFGGEVFPLSHFKQWKEACPNAKFINLYGATECTGMSSYYVVDDVERLKNSIPIGKPLPDTEIFLLDEEGNPIVKPLQGAEIYAIDEEGNPTVKQPADMEIFQHDEKDLATEEPLPDTKFSQIVGEDKTVGKGLQGEICIGGTGLALGYYKDVEKTKEKFVNNPLSDGMSKLIYKTGDIGYYGEDGEIYFAGRKDNQIKHRGYRIELEEIEACGNEAPGVERGVCHYDNDKEIIIFFYEGSIEPAKVKEYLRNKLAGYMVPGKIVKLAKLPVMAGGKIDRKALAKFI